MFDVSIYESNVAKALELAIDHDLKVAGHVLDPQWAVSLFPKVGTLRTMNTDTRRVARKFVEYAKDNRLSFFHLVEALLLRDGYWQVCRCIELSRNGAGPNKVSIPVDITIGRGGMSMEFIGKPKG